MGEWKRPARGFDEISSVFLSSANPDHSAEMIPRPAPSPLNSPVLFPVFCCLSPSPAVESFFACNLSVEIAKNNKTVTLIDFGFERSIVRHLMRSSNPVEDVVPPADTVRPDYKLESIRFHRLPEITLVSPAMPRDRNFSARTLERIFAEDKVQKCNVILINSPMGLDEIAVHEMLTRFRRAIFFIDGQAHSLAKAYSWIKRLSPGCRYYLIGAVCGAEDTKPAVLQNVSKLQKTVFKHLLVGLELRVVTVPLGREARISMQSGKPLALIEPLTPAASAGAIANLCENLLRNE